MDELREELQRVLPDGHPIFDKLDSFKDKLDYQVTEMVADLVDSLDDWKRGIRDWEEVEKHLVLVRDEVKETT